MKTTSAHPKLMFAAMIGALALLSACSTVETPDLAADVEEEGIVPEGWQPLKLRVGIAPFRSALELDEGRYNVEETHRWVLTPDDERLNGPDGLHRRMIQTLREYRMFEVVESIDGAEADTPREELREAALQQGLDVVMVPTVKRHDVGYVDSNSAYGWNMFVWWMVSPILSWWIADEDFDVNLHVDLRLYPTTHDRELDTTRLGPPETVVRSLDDWDEGWHAFSIYSTPGHFTEDNWTGIGELLMPIAENEAHKSALRYVTGPLAAQAREERFLRGIRRRAALVVGVNGSGNPPMPLTRYAEADAQALTAHFIDALNDSVPEAALNSVIGPRATRRAVLDAADELAGLARYNDDVIFSYSGVGTLTDDFRPALVLAQGGEPQMVTLDEVVDRLSANGPRSVTLLLDCSFTAPGDRRCATTQEQLDAMKEAGVEGNVIVPTVERIEAEGIRCIVLSATVPVANPHSMPALEIEDLGHGLFSSYALEALSGEADQDGDRQVTVEEFVEYVGEKVSHIGGLEGSGQTGWFHYSEASKDQTLPAWRR